ncbi:MAG: efflux RND transporter periplasmic adaptor subunit, partial [Pseudomonadota bacterium]|nr:efflux RND transporter periplasmic adaptor subunit [Pseudomonadota bacterium]
MENNPPAEIVLEDSVLDVRTELFEEATLERIIELAGQTAANRRETIVAQSGGTLSEIRVDKGDVVAMGDVIALISADARDENLRQAEQALVAAEIDLDATRALVEEGFVARNTLSDLETAYEAALAAVEQARDQVNDLEVRSTLAGLVENRIAQVGGFVGAGDPVVAVTSMNPLLISARAGEQQIAEFAIGQIAD